MEDLTIKSLLSKGEITFNLLWALFPRNELIVAPDELGQTRAYFVRYHKTFQTQERTQMFDLGVCFVDDNGEKVGFVSDHLYIREFPGSVRIVDLAAYPLRYATSYEKTCDELLERGRKRMEAILTRLHDCTGHGIQTKYRLSGDPYFEKFHVSVAVDLGSSKH